MSKIKLILFIILAISGLTGLAFYTNFLQRRSKIPFAKTSQIQIAAVIDAKKAPRLTIIAENLEVPWALVFLPDRSILFTERPSRVRFIDNKNNLYAIPVATIDDVLNEGEGGLLGITIDPNFSQNHFVYLYYTYANNNDLTLNRVIKAKFENNRLSDFSTIVYAIPGNLFHNGGRIKFGPDGFLYITTGDSQNPSLAQNKDSLAGKILRVDYDGKPTPGNPFDNEVWSYGHRNPQGITWDDSERLWETEHGASTLDEINIIHKGTNYGWPTITGNETQDNMEIPILNSSSDTWAPSGTAYLNHSIFFTGLRGQALYEAVIQDTHVTLKEHLKGEVGRIREVIVGPDKLLYITTSNRDGRGIPDGTDDKIIRVNPSKL